MSALRCKIIECLGKAMGASGTAQAAAEELAEASGPVVIGEPMSTERRIARRIAFANVLQGEAVVLAAGGNVDGHAVIGDDPPHREIDDE